ncbi:MAG: IclR family transcriptional regulator [Dehalococcoidia bacterium]|nr:MAG: IclR family transcriptional regulator [Dehalococcoidia bacterium]
MKELGMNTIEKTLLIIEAFLGQDREIGITKLVELTGLHVSTIHRIASVLLKKGYLTQPHPRAKYSIGPKFLQFGNIMIDRSRIRNIALPFMVKINRVANECVNLVVLNSNEAVYVECVEPPESIYKLRIFTQLGARVPLYCTGVGKVLLAYMTEKEQKEYFRKTELIPKTDNTITDPIQLKNQLSAIKRDGYAIDDEEMELGVRCIATPIRDHSGNVVAAISISGPSMRLINPKVRELEPLLKSTGLDVSRAIGYITE